MERLSAHLFAFLFLSVLPLGASEASDFSKLESAQLKLDGGLMVLEGPVSFENDWGSIQAERGVLQKGTGKKLSFSKLNLEGGVILSLRKEGGQLTSQLASFDKDLGVALFENAKESPGEWVCYQAVVTGDREYGGNLLIQAKKMAALLQRGKNDKGKDCFAAKCRFEAEDDVRISLGDRLTAKGARAYFEGGEASLIGNVEVDLGSQGKVTTDDTFSMRWDPQGKISRLECFGNSEFRQAKEESLGWTVLCPGQAIFDHALHRLFLTSKKEGEVALRDEPQQLVFVNVEEKINADTAEVFLDPDSLSFEVSKIVLQGNVCLKRGKGALEQYILANKVEYHLKDEMAEFFGKGNERVLLFDKINNLQVSAPKIKLERDKNTGKESFQGIGDVRFHFAEKEFQQIRKRFQLEKSRL